MSNQWKNICLMNGATSFISMKGDTLVDDATGGVSPSTSVFNGAQASKTLCGDPSVQSMFFDGVDDYAQFPNGTAWDITEPWSVELLLWPMKGPDNAATIINNGNSTNGVRISIGANDGTGAAYMFWHVNVTGGGDNDNTVANSIKHDSLNHVVLSVASGDATCYINGVAKSKASVTSGDPSIGPMRIGAAAAGLNRFKGHMNIVIYKDVGISVAQALAHYQSAIARNKIQVSNIRHAKGLV